MSKTETIVAAIPGGCGCLGILGWLAFWGLIIAALVKFVFFGDPS